MFSLSGPNQLTNLPAQPVLCLYLRVSKGAFPQHWSKSGGCCSPASSLLPAPALLGSCSELFQKAEAAKNYALFHHRIIFGCLSSLKWIAVCLHKHQGWHVGEGRITGLEGLGCSSPSADHFRQLRNYIRIRCLIQNCNHQVRRIGIFSIHLYKRLQDRCWREDFNSCLRARDQ